MAEVRTAVEIDWKVRAINRRIENKALSPHCRLWEQF